jgi:hypothetical protein
VVMREIKRRQKRQASPSDELREEERQYALNQEVSRRADCLIMQYYMRPGTQDIYQVTDVVLNTDPVTRERIIQSVALRYDAENGLDDTTPPHLLNIDGPSGTIELIAQHVRGQRNYVDTPVPNSMDEWRNLQNADEYCSTIIQKMGTSPTSIYPLDGKPSGESESYIYYANNASDGPIMRRSFRALEYRNADTACDIRQEITQMIVPRTVVDKIIWQLHDGFGHPGRHRTTETIRLRYYWTHMYKDIQRYCFGCRYCDLRKAHNRVAKVPTQIYDYVEKPGSRVHADLTGPFPESGGYVQILVLKDALTKFIALVALNSKDMIHVQEEVIGRWVAIFGPPDMLITDGGREFKNSIATQLAELWGCRKVNTTPRNPRSDGQVENQMRTLKDMLQAFISEHQDDWHQHLAAVAMAYNSTVNDATGFTPFYLMFGREMTSATQQHIEEVDANTYQPLVQENKAIQQWLWQYAANRVVKNSDRSNHMPTERLEYKSYEVGDFFYMRVIPQRECRTDKEANKRALSAKLQYRYCGPYRVTKVKSAVTFQADIHGKPTMVHALNMKPVSGIHKKMVHKTKTPHEDKVSATLGTQTEQTPDRVE